MSEILAHPLRVGAIVLSFLLVVLAGQASEQEARTKSADSSTGWAKHAVDAMAAEQGNEGGRDAFRDQAYALELEARFAKARDALESEFGEATDAEPPAETLVLYLALDDYFEHVEQIYRTASIRQEGYPPLPRTSERNQMLLQEAAQLRANVRGALLLNHHDALASGIPVDPGIEPKLPSQEEMDTLSTSMHLGG